MTNREILEPLKEYLDEPGSWLGSTRSKQLVMDAINALCDGVPNRFIMEAVNLYSMMTMKDAGEMSRKLTRGLLRGNFDKMPAEEACRALSVVAAINM